MSVTRRRLLQIAVVGSLSLAGCTGDGGGDGGSQPADSSGPSGEEGEQVDETVAMQNRAYRPQTLDVEAGATVGWTNDDGVGHTVTSAQFHDTAASWDLDAQASPGDSVTHTFEEAGVYEYYCTIHGRETMCGAVLVGDASLEESLPCEGAAGGGPAGGGY